MRFHEIISKAIDEDQEDFDPVDYPSVATLQPLKAELAEAGQRCYDLWNQDEDGYDEDNGAGGICHHIAEAMAHIIGAGTGAEAYTVADNFEVHVFVVAAFAEGVFQIDIPYRQYEIGGGYNWTKIPNVHFTPDFVTINKIDGDPRRISQYADTGEEEYL